MMKLPGAMFMVKPPDHSLAGMVADSLNRNSMAYPNHSVEFPPSSSAQPDCSHKASERQFECFCHQCAEGHCGWSHLPSAMIVDPFHDDSPHLHVLPDDDAHMRPAGDHLRH